MANNNGRIFGRHYGRTLLLLTAASLSGCSYMPSWLGGETKEKPKLAGERIAVLPIDKALQPDDTLKNVPVIVPPVHKNSDWTTHSGLFPSNDSNLAGGSFDHSNQAAAGNGDAFEHTLVLTPVVGGTESDMRVFAIDAIGNISAHSAADISTILWHNKGVSQTDEIPVQGGGIAYDSGRVYGVSGRGLIAAFDAATGTEIWHKLVHVPFRSAPRVSGDKLFVTTIDNQIFALNTSDGEVAWSQRGISESTGLMNTVTPLASGDAVIAPYSSGEIYVLSAADGREIWSDTLSSGNRSQASALFAGIGADPVVDNGMMFVVTSGGILQVRAVATGQPAWAIPVGSNNTPWIAGEYVYMLSSDNTLVALHKFDGHIRWATKLQSFADKEKKQDPIDWKGPVMVDGKLALVASNGQLLLVDATDGKIVVTKEIPEGIYTSPVVAGGVMYLEGQDATLYSLQ